MTNGLHCDRIGCQSHYHASSARRHVEKHIARQGFLSCRRGVRDCDHDWKCPVPITRYNADREDAVDSLFVFPSQLSRYMEEQRDDGVDLRVVASRSGGSEEEASPPNLPEGRAELPALGH